MRSLGRVTSGALTVALLAAVSFGCAAKQPAPPPTPPGVEAAASRAEGAASRAEAAASRAEAAVGRAEAAAKRVEDAAARVEAMLAKTMRK